MSREALPGPILAVSGSNLSGDVPFSAALRKGGRLEVRSSPAGQRGDLATLCRDVCADHGLRPADIRRLLVDVGPGSYTGLRVAITFVRCLQAFGEVTVGGVQSLALLAVSGRGQRDSGRLRPLLDARRGRYHTALYALEHGALVEREAPQALPVEQAMAAIGADDVVVLPAKLADELGESLRARCELAVARDLTAAELFAEGLPVFEAAAADLEPRYLMASYAEQ